MKARRRNGAERIGSLGQEEILLFHLLPDANAEGVAGDLAHVSRQCSLALSILLLDHDVAEGMNVDELRSPVFVLLDEERPVRQVRRALKEKKRGMIEKC